MKSLQMKRLAVIAAFVALGACDSRPPPSEPLPPEPKEVGDPLVTEGRKLFFQETFNGNGRTCGTCHREDHNLTIDPAFIATLPKDDPLFVAEYVPELAQNFENPKLMREFGLILENVDGTDDLPHKFTMRGVPHVFAQGISISSTPVNRVRCTETPAACPRTGWSGDGAPFDETKGRLGDLRAFAVGAVMQHFTKTTQRREGIDFRLPTQHELDALLAYQLSEGRNQELDLSQLKFKSAVAERGKVLFNSAAEGKCFLCHNNAGANVPSGPLNLLGQGEGNLNFDTGVENLPDRPASLAGGPSPHDDGFLTPGDGTFNTPSLVNAADTGPFFHNNSVATIEAAVAFYDGPAFNNSPAGQLVSRVTGGPIKLDGTQVSAIAAFLRALNAWDNIEEVEDMLGHVARNESNEGEHPRDAAKRAVNDINDAITVLSGAGLHPDAVIDLQEARELCIEAVNYPARRIATAKHALKVLHRAKSRIVG